MLDPARFYIHMKDKYPRGSVYENEYDAVRQRLKDALLSSTIEGERVIKYVLLKEELYHGNAYNDAPDLVAVSFEGYDLKGSINKTQISGRGQIL